MPEQQFQLQSMLTPTKHPAVRRLVRAALSRLTDRALRSSAVPQELLSQLEHLAQLIAHAIAPESRHLARSSE